MNNINFGMDGFTLDGTRWYNAKTGDSFTVKSNYFENNQMILLATDGRSFDLNKIQNDYVQWTGKGAPPKPQESKPVATQLPPEVLYEVDNDNQDNYLDPDDLKMINGLGNINNYPQNVPVSLAPPQPATSATSNYNIIQKCQYATLL